jgi:hypothetical protein
MFLSVGLNLPVGKIFQTNAARRAPVFSLAENPVQSVTSEIFAKKFFRRETPKTPDSPKKFGDTR